MNMSMCEVPVHPVEFLTEADISSLPELPMTLDTDGTYYCDGESTQETTTGAQLFDFDNAIQKVIGNWGTNNILSIADTNDISVSWKKIRGTATSYIALVAPFTFEVGRTIYITKGKAEHILVYDSDGNNLENGISNMYTPNEDFSGYIGIGIDKGITIDSELIFSYDRTFQNAEPYTGGIPSPNPDYPQPIINTYPAGTYRAICGDKVYKVVMDDDLRSVPGVADRVRIDARRGVCWVERKVYKKRLSDAVKTDNNGVSVGKNYRFTVYGLSPIGYQVVSNNDKCSFLRNIISYGLDEPHFYTENQGLVRIFVPYSTKEELLQAHGEDYFVYAIKTPTTHQSVPTLLTTIEPAKSLTIENTVNAPAEVRVRGDSWQGKTTGAQLLSFNSNMDVGANNTFSENKNHFFSSVISVKEGDVFYFSCVDYSCLISGLARTMQSENEPAVGVSYKRTDFAKDGVIVIEPGMNYLTITLGASGVSVNRVKELCMLNAGSTPLPWEPYTGNAPSPSPEYPQDIISVSGILKSSNNGLGGRDKLRESQIVIPELRAIPGTDVRDELVVYEDGTGKIVRRVYKVPQSSFRIIQWVTDFYPIIATNIPIPNVSINGICNIANVRQSAWGNGTTHYFIQEIGQQVVICLDGEKYPTEDDIQAVLDKGIDFYYALKEPIEEPLTAAEVQGVLRTHQYHTEIGFEGLDEHLEPEVEVRCRVLGR